MVNTLQPAATQAHREIHVAYVHPGDYDVIERAAVLQQLPVDEFVLLAAFRTARDTISEFEARPFRGPACSGSQACTAHNHGCSLAQGCPERDGSQRPRSSNS